MKAPNSQPDLPFFDEPSDADRAERGRRLWREELLPVVEAAVTRMTLKEVAHLLQQSAPAVSDALKERDRKGVRLEWLVVLLCTAPEAVRFELLAKLCRIAGYMAPERARKLTEAEEFRIWRAATKRLAPGIAELVEREIENAQ